MDVRPLLVILAGIEGYEVEPSESMTDFSEVLTKIRRLAVVIAEPAQSALFLVSRRPE
jgi:hypothetical protein